LGSALGPICEATITWEQALAVAAKPPTIRSSSRNAGMLSLMHSSASGTIERIVARSFWSAARCSRETPPRHSSTVVGLLPIALGSVVVS
jgi:hypothetical protein